MTKTLKKGLIAVLMFAMAVLVGVAAAAFSYASAEERNPKYGEFEGYMAQFDTALDPDEGFIDELTAENMFPDVADENIKALWQAYNNAKRLYNEFSNTDKNALSSDSKTMYNKLDVIFNDVNSLVVTATSRMVQIYQARVYYKAHEDVEKLTAALEALQQAEYGTGKYEYVLFSTNNLRAYNTAVEMMAQIKAWMLEAIEAIKAIRYFNGTEMATEGYVEAEDAKIVVGNENDEGSKPSLDAVAEILDKIYHLEIDYVCITGELTEEEGDEEVDYYAIYLDAVAEYELQFTYIEAVKALIEDLYLEEGTYFCEEGKAFYIYKEYINDAAEAYAGLLEYAAMAGDINYNDLQYYLGEGGDPIKDSETYKYALDYLTKYIEETDEKIAQVEAAFAELPPVKFNDADYIAALDKITAMLFGTDNEELFFGETPEQDQLIDADILAHDEALYNEMLEEFYADNYADIDDDHQIPDYIIDIYAKYVEAVEEYQDMLDELDDLVKKVQDMVDHHFNNENVTSEYNEIEETWNKFTEEQREWFNEQKVEYPEDPYKDYQGRSDDWQADKKSDQTCEDVLEWVLADINKLADDVSELDSKILDLWAETTGSGDCVYDRRDEVEALIAEYLEYDDAHQAYITNSDKLWEMKAEIDAEQALVDAWIAAVGDIIDYAEGTRICDVWDTVQAAIDAFNAIKHQLVVDGSVSAEIIEGGVVITAETKDDETESDEHKLQNLLQYEESLAEIYAAYTEAVEAMVESKKLIDEAAKLMAMIDTELTEDPGLGEELEAWNAAYDAADAAWENLAKEQASGNTYYGAQEHLMHSVRDEEIFQNAEDAWDEGETEWTYKAAYENYLKAKELKDQYGLEQDIEDLPDPEDVTLADREAIEAAEAKREELNKKYEEGYPSEDYEDWADENVRNNKKLDDVLEAFKKLTEDLDAWIAAVEAAAEKAEYDGYPFNIYESDVMNTEGADADHTGDSYYTLLDWYNELTNNGEAQLEVDYLADAKATLEALKEASDKAIDDLNNDIKDINDKFYTTDEEGNPVLNGEIPAGDDLKMIEDILDRYNKFHQSQKDKIDETEWEKLNDLIDSLDVPDGFIDMIEELYNEVVVNGNVTSYSPYYLEILKTIYSDLNPAVKAMFTVTIGEGEEAQTFTFQEVVDAIAEAIDAARDEDGNLPSLKGAYEKLAELEEALKNATDADLVKELQTAVDELQSALSDAESKLADLEATVEGLKSTSATLDQLNSKVEELDAQLRAYIDEAIQQAKDELQGNIDELEGKVEELQKALEAADGELKAQIEKAIEDLNAAIASAKGELEAADVVLDGKITALSEALETAKTNLDNAINDLKSELTNAINDLKSELEGKINEAKEELEGEIAGLQTKIDGVEKALNDLAADAATKAELEAAKTELQNKLTEAQNKIAALEEAVKNLEAKDVELAGLITGLTNDLAAAKAELKQEIENLESKLNKAITDAVDAAKKELNDKIDSVESELKDLIGTESVADQIAKAKEDIANEIAKALEDAFSDISGFATLGETLAAAFSEYNANITAAYTEAINEAVAELEAKLTGLDSSVDETFADIQAQIDAIKDILGSVTSLDDLDAAVKNLTKAQADLEKAIKDLEAKMNAADADLQAQIDALSSKTTTMLVLVIVLAVVLVAAIVCIILLFIKRKNA